MLCGHKLLGHALPGPVQSRRFGILRGSEARGCGLWWGCAAACHWVLCSHKPLGQIMLCCEKAYAGDGGLDRAACLCCSLGAACDVRGLAGSVVQLRHILIQTAVGSTVRHPNHLKTDPTKEATGLSLVLQAESGPCIIR